MALIHPHHKGIFSVVVLEDSGPETDERGRIFYVMEWGDEFPDRWKYFVPAGQMPLERYDGINNRALNLVQRALNEINSEKGMFLSDLPYILLYPLEEFSTIRKNRRSN